MPVTQHKHGIVPCLLLYNEDFSHNTADERQAIVGAETEDVLKLRN